jgi:hypothetical protein
VFFTQCLLLLLLRFSFSLGETSSGSTQCIGALAGQDLGLGSNVWILGAASVSPRLNFWIAAADNSSVWQLHAERLFGILLQTERCWLRNANVIGTKTLAWFHRTVLLVISDFFCCGDMSFLSTNRYPELRFPTLSHG